MMYKILLLLTLWLPLTAPQGLDYTRLPQDRAQALLQQIQESQRNIGPQQGKFKQVKTHPFLEESQQSQGQWALLPPQKMRWETLSPQAACAVLDGSHLSLQTGKKTRVMDLADQPAFASLGLLLRLATGQEAWTPGPDYDFACYEAPGSYKVVITPKQKELKAFVDTLCLFYTTDLHFHALEIQDPQGGLTHIRLSGLTRPQSLDPALFIL